MGASAFLKSVDFTAFAVNVKTIAPKKYLYQFGHAIWWGKEPMIIRTFLESYNLKGKKIVPFCTSGGSGISCSMKRIKASAKGAKPALVKKAPSGNVYKNGNEKKVTNQGQVQDFSFTNVKIEFRQAATIKSLSLKM